MHKEENGVFVALPAPRARGSGRCVRLRGFESERQGGGKKEAQEFALRAVTALESGHTRHSGIEELAFRRLAQLVNKYI